VSYSIARDLALAQHLADIADSIACRHFSGEHVAFVAKRDGTPVTAADREVEVALKAIVGCERPSDAFVGEEVGASPPRSRCWIVDGIDGTRNFAAGRAEWGTQIALEEEGRPVLGVNTSPALGRRWCATRRGGSWQASLSSDGRRQISRLAVSRTCSLNGGRYTSIPAATALFGDALVQCGRLAARCEYVEPVAHGALMVAAAEVDACLLPWGGPWDFAAVAIIVEEAGGRFSDLLGERRIDHGGPVMFSNGLLHDAALAAVG
jgi:histidinol-phosphatase